jgi:hypothetical protein
MLDHYEEYTYMENIFKMRKNIYIVSCLSLFAYAIVYYCKLGHYYYIALLNVCAFYV